MSDDSLSNKPPLLSGAISKTLGLAKIYADEIHSISVQEKPLTADAIDLCFADVFQGLGLVGEPLHVDVDMKQHKCIRDASRLLKGKSKS